MRAYPIAEKREVDLLPSDEQHCNFDLPLVAYRVSSSCCPPIAFFQPVINDITSKLRTLFSHFVAVTSVAFMHSIGGMQ